MACSKCDSSENEFCNDCFEPFRYSKGATTRKQKVIEVFGSSDRKNDKYLKRILANMEFNNDYPCPVCGEINEVASVSLSNLMGFLGNFSALAVDAAIGTLFSTKSSSDDDDDDDDDDDPSISGSLERNYMRICLFCGYNGFGDMSS